MASGKKKRKAARATDKAQQAPAGPFRHPDGDRRRRGGVRVEDAIAQKRMMQELYGAPEPPGDDRE